MKVRFAISQAGNWFDESESFEMDCVPRRGDMVCIEEFFPQSIAENWEQENGIKPHLSVYEVFWYKNVVHINLK